MIDLLEPTLMLAAPEIVPLTTMINFAGDFAAAVNCAKVETVVTDPPAPPVVPPFRVA